MMELSTSGVRTIANESPVDLFNASFNPTGCNNSYVPTQEEYRQALGGFWMPLITAGSLITIGLYILFFEQVFYTNAGAHRVFRRHIYWIGSVYPFMTLMSLVALLVPKAHNICTAAKIIYMSIGISHFGDLTVLMFGSEEVMLAKTEGNKLNLKVGPSCCCCRCLPSPDVSKFNIRLVLWLCDQMPFTQAAYYLTLLVLIAGNMATPGNVNPDGVFLWLNLFNFASFMSGLYGLQILLYFSKGHLEFYNYKGKSNSVKILVLITNLQSFIFDIMGNYNAFPCVAPYLSPAVYKITIVNSLYIFEMMVLGSYTYWQYHSHEFLKPNPADVEDLYKADEDTSSVTTAITVVGDTEGGTSHPQHRQQTSRITVTPQIERSLGPPTQNPLVDEIQGSQYGAVTAITQQPKSLNGVP
ncbi:organic solute transporter subunit alpha-like [Penaeus monodon]|uniref:organic solute transporter subunit alpha-like n=1 Tax=Penaeus monodon TaxID=6687 RepID=UPI0018A787F4|nr:organic solute transporter subunit alpha-like [Penaeus monodon]